MVTTVFFINFLTYCHFLLILLFGNLVTNFLISFVRWIGVGSRYYENPSHDTISYRKQFDDILEHHVIYP